MPDNATIPRKGTTARAMGRNLQQEQPDRYPPLSPTATVPGVRPAAFDISPGVDTIRLTMSQKGFRTFSRVLALASQKRAPWASASAWPSSSETSRLCSALSSFEPTYENKNVSGERGRCVPPTRSTVMA